MNFWLVSLFTLAQASCYDYEYYDPDTQQSIPGNACAKLAAGGAPVATVGQPTQFATQPAATFSTQFQPAQTTFGTPLQPAQTTFSQFPQTTFSSPASFGTTTTPIYGAPVATFAPVTTFASASTPVYSSTPVYATAPAALSYGTTFSAPAAAVSYGTTTYAAPQTVVTQVRASVATPPARSTAELAKDLQYYKELGERQARQHKQNARTVKDASSDLSRLSLVNTIVAGSGNAAPWYPTVRLGTQKDIVEAYKSEKRIANKNAEDAYQRYQKDPSRLNLLVSKYQDLNADLREAAYHYNVVNTGTFGQNIAKGGLFGGLGGLGGKGGGLFTGLTQIITQKKQSEDLQDIQRQMQRIALQIQSEVKAVAGQKSGTVQGSVQQRMMAMNQYGPQRG